MPAVTVLRNMLLAAHKLANARANGDSPVRMLLEHVRRRADVLHVASCGWSVRVPRVRLQEEDSWNVSGVFRGNAEVVARLLQLPKGGYAASAPGLAGGHGVPLDTEAPE